LSEQYYTPGSKKLFPVIYRNLTARRKGLQRFWLHRRDHHHALTQTYKIIVQKLTSVVELWALLSSHWLPLLIDRSCTYVAMHVLGHNNDEANRYTMYGRACGWTILSLRYRLWLIFARVL